MNFRIGQWVVVGGKLIGIIAALGTMPTPTGDVPAAEVDLVDENGETLNRNLVMASDLMPLTEVEDIPAPRRAHLPADYDPVSGRSKLAAMMSGGSARTEFVSSKAAKPARRAGAK